MLFNFFKMFIMLLKIIAILYCSMYAQSKYYYIKHYQPFFLNVSIQYLYLTKQILRVNIFMQTFVQIAITKH